MNSTTKTIKYYIPPELISGIVALGLLPFGALSFVLLILGDKHSVKAVGAEVTLIMHSVSLLISLSSILIFIVVLLSRKKVKNEKSLS